MRCEICGADACYMVAKDNVFGAMIRNHVRKFAGRCKQCEDK